MALLYGADALDIRERETESGTAVYRCIRAVTGVAKILYIIN